MGRVLDHRLVDRQVTDRSFTPPSSGGARIPRELIAIHIAAALAAVAAAIFVVVPFWPWLVLALWTAGLASNMRAPVARLVRGKRRAAALITFGLFAGVLLPVVLAIIPLVMDAVALVRRLVEAGDARRMLEALVSPPDAMTQIANDDGDGGLSLPRITRLVTTHGVRAWGIMKTLAGATTHALSGLIVFIVAAYVRLAHGERAYEWLESSIPAESRTLRRVASAFMETGRGLFIGIGGAGFAQSVLATIAYVVLDVPHPFVLGLLTMIAATIPGIGTALVWLPIAVGLAVTGRMQAAIVLASVGVSVVGVIDNIIKPVLARHGRLDLPASLVFVSMLGGVMVTGAWGFILGPLIVRIARELISIATERRAASSARTNQRTDEPDRTVIGADLGGREVSD